ncbi:hypothetical protein [Nonomuraea sp. B1E8]|uniref:hypothetical protein n=1 Tax=unclassified Nonomuraea TaxID=2593643 RepID=UPI00325F87A8
MIRRILAGAAIAAAALGFSAAGASADVPNPHNEGQNILSQLSALDDLTALNDVLNDSVKYNNVLSALNLNDIDASVLSNQKNVGDDN